MSEKYNRYIIHYYLLEEASFPVWCNHPSYRKFNLKFMDVLRNFDGKTSFSRACWTSNIKINV